MKTALVSMESLSPYSQARYYKTDKLEKESPADYEKRTWRDKMNVTNDGFVFIPPMAFKKTLETAARFLSMNIRGKGKTKYTKHFKAGVLVADPLILPDKKDEVDYEILFVPSDGRSGGGSRVEKHFPLIPYWKGEVIYYILDETITQDIFKIHIEEAGNFIGVGRFRPENGGFYGRFKVTDIVWE